MRFHLPGKKARLAMAMVVAMGGSLLLYAQGIEIKPYGDALGPVASCPSLFFFTHPNPYTPFYRPLDAALMCMVSGPSGPTIWPSSVIRILFQASLCWLVFYGAVLAGISESGAFMAFLFMLVSQANAMAVLRSDAFSQLGSALFGFLGLLLLYRSLAALQNSQQPGALFLLAPSLCALVSLFFKETGVGYLLAMLMMLVAACRRDSTWRWKVLARGATWLGGAAIFYLAVRGWALGFEIPAGGRHSLGSPVDFLRNFALLLLSSSLPVSSSEFYVRAMGHDGFFLMGSLALTSLFLAVVLYGISVGAKPRRVLLAMAAAMVALLFPVYLFRHVSELYAYNWGPLFSLGVGYGFSNALDRLRRWRFILASLAGILLVSNVLAIQSKASLMRENGERAWALLEELRPWITCVPNDGLLTLVNPSSSGPDYSVYRMHEFSVFKGGLGGLHFVSNRTDFDVEILDFGGRSAFEKVPKLVLTLDRENHIVPVSVPSACVRPS